MARQKTMTPAPAGWYPTGRKAVTGEWDAVAWTGRRRPDADGATPAPWHVKWFRFFVHPWVWLIVIGAAIVIFAGVIGDHGDKPWWWQAIVLVGFALAMSSMVAVFWPLLRFGELPRLGLTIALGLVSGAVASAVAVAIEGYLEPAVGSPMWVDLWFAGVVEETSKLAVPVLLLLFARRIFGDPRTGVLLVLLSGVVFGVWEGYTYLMNATGAHETLVMALVRPFGELTHATWPAAAAALIWLAAHRAGRFLTLAGFVGWLIAMAQHSLHDGLLARGAVTTHNTAGAENMTLEQAVSAAVILNLVALIWFLIAFAIVRVFARELVPPTAIAHNPPRWRPRLHWWGVPHRKRAASSDAAEATPQPEPVG